MDFSSMKYKIDSNDYFSLEQFRVRRLLPVFNCLLYIHVFENVLQL